jgi:hypothetical protein
MASTNTRVGDLDLEVAAKLDTGAKTASLSARDIKRFKRNGELGALLPGSTPPIRTPSNAPGPRQQDQAPRRRLRPESGKAYTARPVIELDICMGQARRSIEVNHRPQRSNSRC